MGQREKEGQREREQMKGSRAGPDSTSKKIKRQRQGGVKSFGHKHLDTEGKQSPMYLASEESFVESG